MPRNQRAVLLLLAVVAAIAAAIIIPSLGDDEKTSDAMPTKTQDSIGVTVPETTAQKPERPAPKTITVRGGKPVGGMQRLEFKKGETVRFVVKSDVADEVHIHGYDLKKDVPAGGRASFAFKAKSDGIYEVELEGRAEQIAQLRINP